MAWKLIRQCFQCLRRVCTSRGHKKEAEDEVVILEKETSKDQPLSEEPSNREPPEIPVVKSDPAKRFDCLTFIAKGGFGKVFKARLIEKNATVAVKLIDIIKGQTIISEELQEIRNLRKLNGHKNIVSFYDAMIHETDESDPTHRLWCTMEYCGGGSLANLVQSTRNRSLPERCIQYISREVLQGLDYIHKNLFIHRDIKGLNIVLTQKAEVKIIDFGLAAELQHPDERVMGCTGTPSYMAPEVIMEDETGYNFKCDIWSFGITVIEMAQGYSPFRRMSEQTIKNNIFKMKPLELQSKCWSNTIRYFIKLCLIKIDSKRPGANILLRHPFIKNQPNENTARRASLHFMAKVLGMKKVPVVSKKKPEER
ncbi:hypothetical protein XENTR_v10019587 [Xenopus tropicalis]|nr:hypothetical protein XENTR_v10019587 [Xenopus tropicalis]KAE8594335.1 hypothetical protein XENTR_v10019587 [Xenopus tropicalis]